jgi:hypothetical protein
MSVILERHSSEVHANQFVLLASTFNSAWCATQKALPKGVRDSNDSCTKIEWPSSIHKLCCEHGSKNWHVTQFPLPSLLLGRCDIPYHWSCKQVRLQDLGQSKFTCHMSAGKRHPQSERVGQLNARQIDWTVFLFRKDCDRMIVHGHAGAVNAAPITTSNYPPTRRGTTTFLPPC